jgi:8-oxo-dGTP diphosphatase
VHVPEDADLGATARRVLREKVGLEGGYFLEQLRTFSGTARDPRGWSLSVVYYAVVPFAAVPPQIVADFLSVDELPSLPFDHDSILRAALERLRGKSAYSTLPAFLLGCEFTLADLQRVYEHVMGVDLEAKSFRRKIDDLDLVAPVKGRFRQGVGRPAQLYRLRDKTLQQFTRVLGTAE